MKKHSFSFGAGLTSFGAGLTSFGAGLQTPPCCATAGLPPARGVTLEETFGRAVVARSETGHNRCLRVALLCTISLFVASSVARAEVRLPAIISDHMVLQAGANAPIWGWAEPNEAVTVTLGDQSQQATPGPDGRWQVAFKDLHTSAEPQTLTIKGKNTLTINDVLVGEVWLGSGQSNMAMTVDRCLDVEKERSAGTLPQVRMFSVERSAQTSPQTDCKGSWVVASPETVGKFSATLYFFGRELHKELKVPIGLINSSWGGTAIEAWTSLDAQSKLAEYPTISKTWVESTAQPWDEAKEQAAYKERLAKWKTAAAKAKAEGKTPGRAPQAPIEPRLHQNHPANLFNGMIAPLVPYGFHGAIWYQGENNSSKPFANLYGLQLATLIGDWRVRFGHEFPFAWVQLPDYRAPQAAAEVPSTWAVIREQMLQALKTPKTGMAITLGLGEENDIHPKNKQGVGYRLAQWALADVYGKQVAASGPLPIAHEVVGDKIAIKFRHADGGLVAKGGEVKGFTIAGPDKKFVWAQARIDGDKVIVSSPEVPHPVAVRYAWADNPVWSLENGSGLPATPFRTDKW